MSLPSNIQPSPIFDEYWKFASRRHEVALKKLSGAPRPWTDDPILQTYKFTNCFRVMDSVSQYLLHMVIYDGKERTANEDIFRILLFKLFNKNTTWEILSEGLTKEPSVANFDFTVYDKILTNAQDEGHTIWGGAYMMTAHGSFGDRRHRMYLRLLAKWMEDDIPAKIVAGSMEDCSNLIKTYRTMKDFLANQYTLDIGYTRHVTWDENDFVAAGPGTIRGINRTFEGVKKTQYADLVRYMVETQDEHFERLHLTPVRIGDRRLHLNDCSNLFCEFDKACRAMFPDMVMKVGDVPGRARIKQKYTPASLPLPPLVFPPKWKVSL